MLRVLGFGQYRLETFRQVEVPPCALPMWGAAPRLSKVPALDALLRAPYLGSYLIQFILRADRIASGTDHVPRRICEKTYPLYDGLRTGTQLCGCAAGSPGRKYSRLGEGQHRCLPG